jgi:two-component system, cell cycle response regulator
VGVRVLIAEDNLVSQTVLREMLSQWGYEVVVTRNGNEAWEVLQQKDAPRLAILDWVMPGLDGVEVCRQVRRGTERPYIYIILLTSKTDRQDLIEGMDAGADDYVTKPFNANELKVRVRAGHRILDLQAELMATQEALRLQAAQDSLTGLWNHGTIVQLLQRELNRAERENHSVGVIMADLDHFKQINDVYGHVVGDAALCQVAQRLRTHVRSYDAVGRYGGEEFLVVLPGCALEATRRAAERIHEAIGQHTIQVEGIELAITMSLGVAATDGVRADAVSMVRSADAAAYQAKANGRNRVEVARHPDPAEEDSVHDM